MASSLSDRVLDESLELLKRTGDVEAVLARHPQQAEALRPLLEASLRASAHYAQVPPPPGALSAGRARFLAASEVSTNKVQTRERGATAPGRYRMLLAVKVMALILSLVMGTSALGGGAVWAAEGSLPGDALYPVKIAWEQARMQFAPDDATRMSLALERIGVRLGEAQQMVQAGRALPDDLAEQVQSAFRYALQLTEQAGPDAQLA